MSGDLDRRLLEETRRALATIELPPRERWTQRPRSRFGVLRAAAFGVGFALLVVAAAGVGQTLFRFREGSSERVGSPGATALPASPPASTPSAAVPQTVHVSGGAWSLALDVSRGRLYVTGPDALTVVDSRRHVILDALTLAPRAPDPRPGGAVAVDKRTGHVYVTDFVGDQLYVIDGAQVKLVTAVPVGRGPTAIALDSSSGRVYVANLGHQSARAAQARPGSISVVDAASARVVATVDLNGHPIALALHVGRQLLYVAQLDLAGANSRVTAIDATSGQQVGAFVVGPPVGIAVNEDLDAVYVLAGTPADEPPGPNRLWVIEAGSGRVRQLGLFPETSALGMRPNAGHSRFYVAESFPDGGGRLGIYQHLGSVDRFVRVAMSGLPAAAGAVVADSSTGEVYAASRADASVTAVRDPPGP